MRESKGNSKEYYEKLNEVLKNSDRSIPSLLIDLNRLDDNCKTLRKDLDPDNNFRLVVKSLPSFDFLSYVMDKMNAYDLMVFHQPFLSDLSLKLDRRSDILIGKPMPIRTARYYFNHLPTDIDFDPFNQIQWLVDTELRIQEYVALANELGKRIRLNLEIDVGLHRGGWDKLETLKNALKLISENKETIEFSGFMGYDPHLVKIPAFIKSQKRAFVESTSFYNRCILLLKEEFSELYTEELTFNGGGSPTVKLHQSSSSPLNDLSAGSCLVCPTTFDIPSLEDYSPACFIATPVLKIFEGTTLPGLEKFKGILNLLKKSNRQSCFIYGGFWKADYCYPFGIKQNRIFSPSTNQTMLNYDSSIRLDVDDYVFLRPHQSEFVFLQFGNIIAFRNNILESTWPVLNNR